MKTTNEELRYRQALPLEDKIALSCERIESWWNYFNGQVYVSFSGGKDSTVLLDLVRNQALVPDVKDIPAVFIDTGLEYPEIREFVKTIDNVLWIKPKMTFKNVIDRYGYPVISKEQSRFLYEYHTSKSDKLKHIRMYGNKWGMGRIRDKWLFMLDAPFKISHMCCNVLKKNPAYLYEKRSGRKPIIGSMTEESSMRNTSYLRYGCNAFDRKRPISMPMSFWKEQDVWDYIHKYSIPYSSIYDMGYDRTGCMFCMFGVHLEKEPNRFQKMQKTHPTQYNFCINRLGLGTVLDYIGVEYED